MNVDELRTVQRTERQKDSLQHLRDSFYRDVADYIAARKQEREDVAAAADDPFSSPEVSRLTDEIETAEEVVESIYERRVGKIVKRATFAAAGMAAEDEGLTTEERELFDDLVDRIETNRAAVLDTLAGGADGDSGDAEAVGDATAETGDAAVESDATDAPPSGEPSSPPVADQSRSAEAPPDKAPDPDDLLAEAMGAEEGEEDTETASRRTAAGGETGGDPQSPSAEPSDGTPAPDGGATDTERTTLRITRDVGEIFGVDEREYDLANEDVVTLPTANAEPLLEKDAAERLDAE
jgi:DNA replication factor GINS